MGRASTNKKVARAARTAGTPGQSQNRTWTALMAVLVVVGVVGVFLAARSNDDDAAADVPPRVGDHWHAAYGVNVCGEWQAPFSDLGPDRSGIHTHDDGLIHLHPSAARFTGGNANLAVWGEMVGMELTATTLSLPDGRTFEDGDDCGDEPGQVQVMVWDDPADTEGRLLEGDPATYAPQDGEVVTIAFAPEGAELEKSPTAVRLADPERPEQGQAPLPLPGEEGGPATTPEGGAPPAEGEAPAPGTEAPAPEGEAPAAEGGAPAGDQATTTTAAP